MIKQPFYLVPLENPFVRGKAASTTAELILRSPDIRKFKDLASETCAGALPGSSRPGTVVP